MRAGGDSRETDEATQLTIDFWDQLHTAAVAAGAPTRKNNTPLRDKTYWAPIGAGTNAYVIAWKSHAKKPQVGVYLGLYGDNAPAIRDSLTARREELEAAYGGPLDWFSSDEKKIIDRLPANPNDRADWPRQHQWLVEHMKRLDDVFTGPVLETIGQIQASSMGEAQATASP